MSLQSIVSGLLAMALVISVLCAVLGLAMRLRSWLKAPNHPRFALAPVPASRVGVALRVLREGVLFQSLWRASPVTWMLGWPFHVALLAIAAQHLRYLLPGWSGWVEQVAARGRLASAVLVLCLLGLWGRRILVARVRHVSRPSDHLWLVLLLALAASGVALKYLLPTDVAAVKHFVGGLFAGRVHPLPSSLVLWLHLLLASVLVGLFPFSKLLHGAAVFVNPTRASRGSAGHGAV